MFGKGDIVSFGRPNGEKTEGVVIKVNGKSLLIETTEARGLQRVREAGKKWRVPNDPRFVAMVTPAAKVAPVAKRVDRPAQDINENAFAAEQDEAWWQRRNAALLARMFPR
jgi:hypothetical protein